jgi:exopolysaccharide biosynthesis WecB/TagA/CpsF family protein
MGPPSQRWVDLSYTTLAGQKVAVAGRSELTDAMAADCRAARTSSFSDRPRLFFSANGQSISLRDTDAAFRDAMDAADVVHADGGFLVTASRLLGGTAIRERSATTDLMHDFAARAATDGLTFYLLGADEDVNRRCALELERRYPRLRVVGRHHGYLSDDEMDELVNDINLANPDVLWLALGKPREQFFALRNVDRLKAGWIVTCGGCFNFVVGDYKRAPMWMQRLNLEWLHRMMTRPRQLFWRYLVTTPHALWLVVRG